MRSLNKKLEKMLLGNIFPFYATKAPKLKKKKKPSKCAFLHLVNIFKYIYIDSHK